MDQRFTLMDQRFTDHFQVLSTTIDAIHQLLDSQLKIKADKLDVAGVDTRVNCLENRAADIENKLQALQTTQTGFFAWLKTALTPPSEASKSAEKVSYSSPSKWWYELLILADQ